MSVEQDQPVSIARAGRQVDLPDKTGSHESESYLSSGTGEGVFGGRTAMQRMPRVPARAFNKEKNGKVQSFPPAATRRAFRLHWNAAVAAAEVMLQAAEAQDMMEVGIAADELDQSLGELWNLREGRDIDWQTILNHMQGMMRTFFLEKRAETLTAEQCKRIVELVKDYLGPATKTIDDLNEVLRLIDDAGFDPYAAISGDPVSDDKE